MIPFALPMVLAPRITRRLATRFSGRSLLAAGLAITVVGNAAFWLVGRSHLAYGVFLVAMVIAGCGAGLLNGQTVKVLQGAVPEDRAGMASGLASTTRFIGILVSVAALGAILSDVARERFVAGAARTGLAMDAVREEAAHVTSGDLAGLLAAAPAGAREALRSAALRLRGRLRVGSDSRRWYRVHRLPACLWLDQQPGDRPGSSASAGKCRAR